jgi:hypothetical protein
MRFSETPKNDGKRIIHDEKIDLAMKVCQWIARIERDHGNTPPFGEDSPAEPKRSLARNPEAPFPCASGTPSRLPVRTQSRFISSVVEPRRFETKCCRIPNVQYGANAAEHFACWCMRRPVRTALVPIRRGGP